jgi:hypothetical protein
MVKEFTPYSNLWLTTTNWFKNVEIWKSNDISIIILPHSYILPPLLPTIFKNVYLNNFR